MNTIAAVSNVYDGHGEHVLRKNLTRLLINHGPRSKGGLIVVVWDFAISDRLSFIVKMPAIAA